MGGLCILAGVGLGVALPNLFQTIAEIEYANVNLVVTVFIWIMICPMMINVVFASVKDIGKKKGSMHNARCELAY